ncbi:MAG: heme-binding protein [Pseudomonadota bacterium]
MRKLILAATMAAVSPMTANATEEPAHAVILKSGAFEIRQYEPMIIAEVEITGDMRRAGNSGFRPLADFIFGNNTARSKIDMTAPVTRVKSEKIEMTAPVTRTVSDNDVWTVSFVMPSKWTMDTLPVPNNQDVSIKEVPGELMATVRFSGIGREPVFVQKETALQDWLAEQGYEMIGAPRYAGYDAPYVPGPMRRNEVMIPVQPAAPAS